VGAWWGWRQAKGYPNKMEERDAIMLN